MKKGIIQSRGLGDIIIALPIARYYHDRGCTVYWPICEEFVTHFEHHVPWVNWIPVVTDHQGLFFYDTPRSLLLERGVSEDDIICLYQYLSAYPALTDPELFALLKFDQYKYWVSEVPFTHKWRLSSCISRDLDREQALVDSLDLGQEYCVTHFQGSSWRYDPDLSWVKMPIVSIDDHKTTSIFDWITVLANASMFVGIDSVFANLVDSLDLAIDQKFWIRRSHWDLTPVLGQAWTMISTDQSVKDPVRVDVRAASLRSNVPFKTGQTYPTNFMWALK